MSPQLCKKHMEANTSSLSCLRSFSFIALSSLENFWKILHTHLSVPQASSPAGFPALPTGTLTTLPAEPSSALAWRPWRSHCQPAGLWAEHTSRAKPLLQLPGGFSSLTSSPRNGEQTGDSPRKQSPPKVFWEIPKPHQATPWDAHFQVPLCVYLPCGVHTWPPPPTALSFCPVSLVS